MEKSWMVDRLALAGNLSCINGSMWIHIFLEFTCHEYWLFLKQVKSDWWSWEILKIFKISFSWTWRLVAVCSANTVQLNSLVVKLVALSVSSYEICMIPNHYILVLEHFVMCLSEMIFSMTGARFGKHSVANICKILDKFFSLES